MPFALGCRSCSISSNIKLTSSSTRNSTAKHSNRTGVANLIASPGVVAFYKRLGYEDSGSLVIGKAVARL